MINGMYIAIFFLFEYNLTKQNANENGMMYKANQLTYTVKIIKADKTVVAQAKNRANCIEIFFK